MPKSAWPELLAFFVLIVVVYAIRGYRSAGGAKGDDALGRSGREGGTADHQEQAVVVYLDGTGLPDEVYEHYDTMTLESLLTNALEAQNLGLVDGTETGPTETTVFMYGPDAERLFGGIEKVLRSYPLCRNARVVIRPGGSGGPEREVRIPAA